MTEPLPPDQQMAIAAAMSTAHMREETPLPEPQLAEQEPDE